MMEDKIDETKLGVLLERAKQLPRSIDPPPEVWSSVRAAIEKERDVLHLPHSRRLSFWQRPAFLAAAALLLVATSSAVTAVALRRSTDPAQSASVERGVASRAVTGAGGAAAPAPLVQFTAMENEYILTANRLSELLASNESGLAPETLAKLRESLKIIDAAILEARRALAADPANRTLIEMLSASYNQKLDLLRRTTEMARS